MGDAEKTRGDLLRETLEADNVAAIELARRLLPANSPRDLIESKRRQVNTWKREGGSFSDETATAIAAALNKPPDYFKLRPPLRPIRQRREELVAAQIAELTASLAVAKKVTDRLRARVSTLERVQRELREQVDDLRTQAQQAGGPTSQELSGA